MPARNPADIRNITLAGHGGCGKTTLTERLLLTTGRIQRMGSVEEGNTVTDHTDEERAHHHSLSAGVVHFTYDGKLVNLIDTPGLADFVGHAIASLPAAETAAICVDAAKGVETITRRMMLVAAERDLPRIIVVNKIDLPEVDLAGLVAKLRDLFGSACLPVNLPTEDKSGVVNVFDSESGASTAFSSVEEAHTQIIEQVVEVEEELMEAYLEGSENLDNARVHAAFERAMREGHLIPVCFVSAKSGAGAEDLLHVMTSLCPSPLEGNRRTFIRKTGDEAEQIQPEPDPDKPVIAHVFKVAADPFVGKLGVFRIHQGTVRTKSELRINDEKRALRLGHLFKLQGKEHIEVDELGPGDIGAVAKIEEMAFNGVLHEGQPLELLPLPLPKPMYGLAITLPNHKDESKFGPATAKLQAEDPCFKVERIEATKQTVARGLGEMHLRVIIERLRSQFGIEVETQPPKVAYKETITANADGHHRHKKQTGGAGEFGEVYLRVAPLPPDSPEAFEFENAVVGGTIPRQFMPAIEKGVRQVLSEGAIAGYPMTGIRVEVYDGKHHPVDSKEVAFVKAGRRAFIDAVQKARPVLLEPFVELEVTVPNNYMGDISGDLSTKRGRVQDTEMAGPDTVVIKAVAPLGELQNYSNELKSITGGAGSYAMDYSHDEQTPPHIQAEVIAAYKPKADED